MTTAICRQLGIKYPIFAFSHCRDVVAAVSNAGGIGVYGGALNTPEQVEIDLRWIERQVGDKPYGIDLLLPMSYVEVSEEEKQARIPAEHRRFLDGMMQRFGVPPLDPNADQLHGLLGDTKFTPEQNAAILELVFKYNPKVFVSALGTPPAQLIEKAHARGMLIGALAGKAKHAIRHKQAGVDFVVAASYEAGGHTGEIGSMVLVPEVADAVAPLPVLAAGGIGRGRQVAAALALGAQGVWCGSVWLTSTESDLLPVMKQKLLEAGSDETVRAKCFTGKYARFLRTAWSDEWDRPEAPAPLPAPLQTALIADYIERIAASAASGKVDGSTGAGALITSPVGQIVGAMNVSLSAREIVREMMEEMTEATMRLTEVFEEAG
ncbi:nitronate monooxygenase family protein [Ferrovibrio sp.]|uniref:nitronate monooxygenase n=1 Tax=Ferrovibrio sp. TaxID=1917215 RepID=UPI0025BFA5F9|nr:nitronate monooxygenase family protein [Ferrovibrio sp.]MBX3452919.1 nitronate monooxygenase [Ferrovibrio sp.]